MINKSASIITGIGAEHVGKTEEFKRPDHNDFATSSELKKRNFSGIRNNSIADTREVWVEGEIKMSMATSTIRDYPRGWEALYAKVFDIIEEE